MVAAPVPAPAPEPVVVDKQFTLSSDVLFDFNKATLAGTAGQALDNLYSQIEQARPKDGVATVIGYTDRIGSDAYNQKLSEQRARTVADYLVGKHSPAGKVNVEGRGKGNPVTGDSCTSKSKKELIVCLAPDRRVEVKVEGIRKFSSDPQAWLTATIKTGGQGLPFHFGSCIGTASGALAHLCRNLIEQLLPASSQLAHQSAVAIGRQHPHLLEGDVTQYRALFGQQAPVPLNTARPSWRPWKRSTEMVNTGPLRAPSCRTTQPGKRLERPFRVS